MTRSEPIPDDDLRASASCRLITTGRSGGQSCEARVWFAKVADRVFVLAQDRERAHRVCKLGADPIVRVRVERRTLEGRVHPLEAGPDDRFACEAMAAKYGPEMAREVASRVAARTDRP